MNLVQGDLFAALPTDKNIIIPHVCNNVGAFSAGFVAPLSKKWPQTKTEYQNLKKTDGLHLGWVQFVRVEENVVVANMIAQNGLIGPKNPVPLNYQALEACLETVADYIQENRRTGQWFCDGVIAPKFGSGLAGGDWSKIEAIILRTLGAYPVTIYYL